MLITIISAVVYEIGIIMLDLLLLPSLTHHISTKYKHISTARAKDGKSFCTLQVRMCVDMLYNKISLVQMRKFLLCHVHYLIEV